MRIKPNRTQPETKAPEIHELRLAMERSAEAYRAVHTRTKAARFSNAMPNPEIWKQELDALLAEGLEDITIGYWRVSNEMASEEMGPEVQRQQIIAYAQVYASPRYKVDLWVWDIETGKSPDRPGYLFLQSASKNWQVVRIICAKLDRFSRGGSEGDVTIRALKKLGTSVASASERIADDYMGDLVRIIFMGIARYEASVIAHRTFAGKVARIKRDGTYLGGEAPYGYSIGNRWAPGAGIMKIDEDEARLVRMVFKLRYMGYRPHSISDALARWKIPLRRGKQTWEPFQVNSILNRESQYRAETHFGSFAEAHTPILQPEILQRRPNPKRRKYATDAKKLPWGTQVPDDIDGPPLRYPRRGRREALSEIHAVAHATCWALHDTGKLSPSEIAAELRRLNIPGPFDGAMNGKMVESMLADRDYLTPYVVDLGIQATEEPLEGTSHLSAFVQEAFDFITAQLDLEPTGCERFSRFSQLHSKELARRMNAAGMRKESGADWEYGRVIAIRRQAGVFKYLPRPDQVGWTNPSPRKR